MGILAMKHFKLSVFTAVLATSLLYACGGGGSSGISAGTTTVSGTAATGAAITAGTVTLKCVSGTSTAATTGTDGSFAIDIGAVTLPCVGRVDYKDAAGAAQKLHTFITAAGTANITPITELLVANLTGGTAVDAFDKFDATKSKAITAAQLTAAIAAIKAYFGTTLGLAVTDFPADPVGTKFLAKSGATAGDKTDALLDALAAQLKLTNITLANVVGAVTTSGIAGGGSVSAAGSSFFKVTNAAVVARNGTFPVSSALGQLPSGNTNIDYNGNSTDGKFEWDVQFTSAGVIKSAYIWYFEAGNAIAFFGCNAGSIPCTGVTSDVTAMQVTYVNAAFPEIRDAFPGPATLFSGGASVTVNGSVAAK